MFCTGLTSPDVNNDSFVTPLDALLVINDLNANGAHLHEPLTASASVQYVWLDVSHDGWVTPLDALLVINYLNANGAGPFVYECPSPEPELFALNVDPRPENSPIPTGEAALGVFRYSSNTEIRLDDAFYVVNIVNAHISDFRLQNAADSTVFVHATRVEPINAEWVSVVFEDLDLTGLLNEVEPLSPATLVLRATVHDPLVDETDESYAQVYADLNRTTFETWLNPPAVHHGATLVAGTRFAS